jgi:hypothetical protein
MMAILFAVASICAFRFRSPASLELKLIAVLAQNFHRAEKAGDFRELAVPSRSMVTILFAVLSILVFRFRSRAALELKVAALQHHLAVLRRQRPGRFQLSALDRLLWVLLYRIWPQVIDAMILVKPATVIALAITASRTTQDRCRNS